MCFDQRILRGLYLISVRFSAKKASESVIMLKFNKAGGGLAKCSQNKREQVMVRTAYGLKVKTL